MTVRTATVLKTFFETGDYPTQDQFGDFIDSTTNTLITGDVTIDSNNVATVNPSILSGFRMYSTQITRTNTQGAGTLTVTTTFLPKLIHVTTRQGSNVNSAGSIGRSNGTTNSCLYSLFSGVFLPISSGVFCGRIADSSGNGMSVIINAFTSTSFNVVFTVLGTGMNGGDSFPCILEIDVLG